MMRYMWMGACTVLLVVSLGCGSTRNPAPEDSTRSIRTSCDKVVLPEDAKGKKVSSIIVADLRDGSHLDLSSMDEEEFAKVIRKHGHLSVGSKVLIGDQELVCEIEEITNYRELKRIRKHLEEYKKKVRKFVASDKAHLKLE